MQRHVKHSFPVIVDENSRILILGSVPSVKSVEYNFYYMHPLNRFWQVLSRLLGEDFTAMNAEQKTRALKAHNVALYDSVEECDIEGSKDNKISNAIPANIPALMQNSKIEHIFCNGKASYNYLIKFYPQLASVTTLLPSTSPANAVYSLEKLTEKWKVVLGYIA